MGLLAPWFLAGLTAAAIPLYVHLLRQYKTVPRPFSSLMFFERRTQSSVKHRRLKYLLLLAMRLALILLLALTFANFFVTRDAVGSEGRKLVIFAIDNSFSMRAGSRLADAKREAISAIDAMRAGDRGQVLAFQSGVTLMSQPTAGRDELKAAVQAIQPSDGRSLLGELSRALRSISQTARGPVEAHVFSDLQKTSLPMPFSELTLPANTQLRLHPAASKTEPNFFVESVQAPRSVYQPKNVRVRAAIAGSATEAREFTAELLINGKPNGSQPVKLGPNGRAGVEFVLADAPYGLNRGELRIASGGALAQDDVFPFAFERKETTRILFVHEARNPRAILYFRAALEASPDAAFSLEPVTPEQTVNLMPSRYGLVVLSDVAGLPRQFEESLESWVKGGGGVLVSLGPVASTRPLAPVAGLKIEDSRYAARNAERFLTAAGVDATHPALWKTERFEDVKFYQAARVDAGPARVLARLSDGSPLVLERKMSEGRALVFTSTFDNISNDLPLHASFVPFVEQAAKHLAGMDPAPALYAVGDFVELRRAQDRNAGVEVLDPSGARALSLKEAAGAQNFRLDREGFFEIRRANGRHELIAAHADRAESDLTRIPDETLKLWAGGGAAGGNPSGATGREQRPYSLWWWFALALLVVSLGESVLASRYLGVEQTPAGAEARISKEAA